MGRAARVRHDDACIQTALQKEGAGRRGEERKAPLEDVHNYDDHGCLRLSLRHHALCMLVRHHVLHAGHLHVSRIQRQS